MTNFQLYDQEMDDHSQHEPHDFTRQTAFPPSRNFELFGEEMNASARRADGEIEQAPYATSPYFADDSQDVNFGEPLENSLFPLHNTASNAFTPINAHHLPAQQHFHDPLHSYNMALASHHSALGARQPYHAHPPPPPPANTHTYEKPLPTFPANTYTYEEPLPQSPANGHAYEKPLPPPPTYPAPSPSVPPRPLRELPRALLPADTEATEPSQQEPYLGHLHANGPADPTTQFSPGRPRRRRRLLGPTTPVKSFTCATCGSTFTRKSHLERHNKSIHVQARAFVCDVCGSDFTRSDTLARHVQQVHEGKKKYAKVPVVFVPEEEC